jgi:hypothetical protein
MSQGKNHLEGERQLFEIGDDGQYRPVSDNNEVEESGGGVFSWANSLRRMGGTAKEAKQNLRSNSEQRARRKLAFLPDERESMITKEETEVILHRSFDYMIGLVEFNLILLKFQLNHHLYTKFKKEIRSSLLQQVNDTNWDLLVQKDESLGARLQCVQEQIVGLRGSLKLVFNMQRNS